MMVWLDLETTGLNEQTNRILEVGIAITHDNLQIATTYEKVLRYTGDRSRLHPIVQEMHEDNGLWEECAKSNVLASDAETEAIGWLRTHGVPEGELPLVGSSIHFDRRFLRRWMPDLDRYFHYRNIDVSTLGGLASLWYPKEYLERPQPAKKPHRALEDILDSIRQLKYWRDSIMRPIEVA